MKNDIRIRIDTGADRSCNVGGPACSNRGSNVRTECFACGLSACTGCSDRIPYYTYGIKRVCRDCMPQQLNTVGEALVTALEYVDGISPPRVQKQRKDTARSAALHSAQQHGRLQLEELGRLEQLVLVALGNRR